MTALALRSAASVNAVSQLHAKVTRSMWAPMWPERARDGASRPRRHQRRARSDLDLGGYGRPVRDDTSGSDWLERHDDPAMWNAVLSDSRRGALGRAAGAAALSLHLRPRARAAALDGRARRHAARRRCRHAARARLADDRVRAAVRRLQAARADLPPTPSAWRASSTRPNGPSRSSSPASRIRPTTSASTTCSASTSARSIRCSAAGSPS